MKVEPFDFKHRAPRLRDARTGELLWSHSPGVDVKAGLAADIDPRHAGCEVWGGPGGLRMLGAIQLAAHHAQPVFAIWWDGDRLRELIGRSWVTKWDWEGSASGILFRPEGRGAPRGPNLIGDIIGDWREELVLCSPDQQSLRVYSTTIPRRTDFLL